jgi:hypothetical protein
MPRRLAQNEIRSGESCATAATACREMKHIVVHGRHAPAAPDWRKSLRADGRITKLVRICGPRLRENASQPRDAIGASRRPGHAPGQ